MQGQRGRGGASGANPYPGAIALFAADNFFSFFTHTHCCCNTTSETSSASGDIRFCRKFQMHQSLVQCNVCEAVFTKHSSRKNHVRNVHQVEVNVTFLDNSSEGIKRDPDGQFKCICGKRFSLPDSLRRHARTCTRTEEEAEASENDEEEEETVVTEGGPAEAEVEPEEMVDDVSMDLSYNLVGIDLLVNLLIVISG